MRKLEFLLADALQKGCDCVVTCGPIQSNYCRATAIAARQLGLQAHLVLRWSGRVVSFFSILLLLLIITINYRILMQLAVKGTYYLKGVLVQRWF